MARSTPVWAAFSALASLLAGCAQIPTINARHAPFFLEQTHTSQIVAIAYSGDGLDSITIDVTSGSQVSCPRADDNLPSEIPCRKNATTQSTTCVFQKGETTGSCSFSQPIGLFATMVTYAASVRSKNGQTASQLPITYSGGRRPDEEYCWFKWGFLPILDCSGFEPLMPVWWQIGEASGGPNMADRIDISFNVDADFAGNALTYSNMLEPMIRGAFFNYQQPYGEDYFYTRHYFTLWTAPPGADKDSCANLGGGFNFNGFAGMAAAYTDGEVIIHDDANQPRACATIGFGGSAWIRGNDAAPANRLVHESGHMLFAVADEYCCDGGYGSYSLPRNVSASKADCESVATSIGVPTDQCVQISNSMGETVNFWRISDGSLEIMKEDTNINSDWRDASDLARKRLISRCMDGNCF